MSALVLAAHGSAEDPRWADAVHRHAETVARTGREVRCVFWRQPPYFSAALDGVSPGDVTVVPVMTAGGYYARRVLPEAIPPAPGRTVRFGPAIGELPAFADLVLAQARAAARRHGLSLDACHLLVVGHGTERSPRSSGRSTHAHVRTLRALGVARSVSAAFLEQAPRPAAALATLPADANVVVVPNLIADGDHATTDIPAALGDAAGRRLVFAAAAGEHPACADLILRSAALAATGDAS